MLMLHTRYFLTLYQTMAERDANYWQTQSHVSANKFDISRLHCEEIVHASSIPSGFPDVYVNGEDLTITVDPVKNSMWVRDDASGHHRHAYSVARGALKDHRGVMMVQHMIDELSDEALAGIPMPTGRPQYNPTGSTEYPPTPCSQRSDAPDYSEEMQAYEAAWEAQFAQELLLQAQQAY